MSRLSDVLGLPLDRPVRCLALGAHPDDIEIGAGGTLLRLAEERPDAAMRMVVLSATDERAVEARSSAAALGAWTTAAMVTILSGRDGYLPYDRPAELKAAVASVVPDPPDLVLVHRRDDAHQDHRFVSELAWQLFRRSTILEYEVPKWDGDVGQANVYVPLPAAIVEAKVDHLMRAFPSQQSKDWYTAETFRASLRLRGVECRAASGFAEAFIARKLVV